MKNGLLVVFEGIDGSGKTTLAHAIAEELKKTFPKVILTREPGATALGKTLRGLILDGQLSDRAEFLLFAADRAQHCAERIRPALLENAIVISDRMADSSLIYQGISHGFRIEELRSINDWAMNGVKPDITFYLRIDPTVAHTRLVARGPLTKFETIEQLTHT
jgi:dTMP kinase